VILTEKNSLNTEKIFIWKKIAHMIECESIIITYRRHNEKKNSSRKLENE
jgi:predicted transcriptional regulator